MKFPLVGMLGRTQNHLDEIIEFIKPLDPDVIGLVEVDEGSYRSHRKNQAEVIAKELGHFHSYSSKYGKASMWQHLPLYKQQGNAFLAKNTICGEKFHFFEKGMKRLVFELELGDVTIFLVHLSLSYKERQEQLGHLYTLVNKTNRPYIVAGDFNARMGEKEIKLFLAATGLANVDKEGQPSYPSSNPRKHLDFILHSPEVKITHFWMPQTRLSDHLPLVCDFEL
ncbi:MAG: endonuclease/exonuclease/phosphatase family protein [Kiritimatiellales bacterium]|nr:endonuclease/exonuclease/phosphatase family protein [Kiritimatiellales bacterium]